MGHGRGSASVALILVVLGLLGVAVVAFSHWQLPDVGSGGQLRSATATVVESAQCGATTRGDLVEVEVDGRVRRLRLDGCGHHRGQRLPVQVPVGGGDRAVPAGGQDAGGGTRSRVSWVLVTLAGVAGGGYSLLLVRRPRPA